MIGDPKSMPTRQPAILKLLLKEFNSRQFVFDPSKLKILKGFSFKIKLYGLSLTNNIFSLCKIN